MEGERISVTLFFVPPPKITTTMKVTNYQVQSLWGKLAITCAVVLITSLLFHFIWDLYDNDDRKWAFAFWIVNTALTFIVFTITIGWSWLVYLALAYVWSHRKKA